MSGTMAAPQPLVSAKLETLEHACGGPSPAGASVSCPATPSAPRSEAGSGSGEVSDAEVRAAEALRGNAGACFGPRACELSKNEVWARRVTVS